MDKISIFLSLLLAGVFCDDLTEYLQPDDVLIGNHDFETNPSLCTRKCDGVKKICYYKLYTELYSSMGHACKNCTNEGEDCLSRQCVLADGRPRGMLTFNRMYPGPSIQVCLGDYVIVDVFNRHPSTTTSIHWHGIRHKGTPYSDGVPKVTQCPILPGATFRYSFNASDPGTFFYHSHSGTQKLDGLSGTLIVRSDDNVKLYDYDLPSHVVYVTDWMHLNADQYFPGRTDKNTTPDLYLINGRGIYSGMKSTMTIFNVKKGYKYRFRLIGGACLTCITTITFFRHNLSVIFADGAGPIVPTIIDKINLNSGDRFDVILDANQPVDTYWIMVRGVGPKSNSSCRNVQQFALLKYEGDDGHPSMPYPGFDKDLPNGITLNPGDGLCNNLDEVCLSHLQAPSTLPDDIQGPPDHIFMIDFEFYNYKHDDLFESGTYQSYFAPTSKIGPVRGLLNNISLSLSSSPLMSQYDDIPKEAFCPPECYTENIQKSCSCLNIIKAKLNSIVDIILTGTGVAHPFHLHGHNFYVLEEGQFTENRNKEIIEMTEKIKNGMISNRRPIMKDTVGIPAGGYVIIRFKADNPGFWFIHCHYLLHLDSGMSGVLQVGERSDFPPVPEGFPKCGDYKPSIKL